VYLLEDKCPNRPFNLLQITQKLLNNFSAMSPENLIPQLKKLTDSLRYECDRVERVFEELSSKMGHCRAEFRLNFNDLASIGNLLVAIFEPKMIMDLVMPVTSSSLSKLGSFYTKILSEPIFCGLLSIRDQIINSKLVDIPRILMSISLFESLLTYTVFSGKSNCYIREIIWAKKTTLNPFSLELMTSILKYNRIVFDRSFINLNNLTITCRNEAVFEAMMRRLGNCDKNSLTALNLCFMIRNPMIDPTQKALALWQSYFNIFPTNDFREDSNERWKKESLADNAEFKSRSITSDEAVDKVFDLSMADVEAWKKPHLKAYQMWNTEKPEETPRIFLKKVIDEKIIEIQFIRYHCRSLSTFFSHGRVYQAIDASPLIQAHKRSFELINAAEAFAEAESPNDPSSTALANKRVGFSQTETINLIRGINHFGIGNWSKILKCSQLSFHEKRNGTSLKDKYITLKNKMLQIENGNFYVEGYMLECLEPIPESI